MSPSELIRSAAADGIRFHRERATDQLRVLASKTLMNRWRPIIEEKKEEILSILMEREERAAIYEFDADLTRSEAEERADLFSSSS